MNTKRNLGAVLSEESIGRVQFNVSICADMSIEKEVKDGTEGKLALVMFTGVEDAKHGQKQFMMQVWPYDVDSFHSILSSIEE